MATVRPFRALRPRPQDAPRVAAVPYDVIDVDEARLLARDNPLSFLRVSRAELELPAGTDPHADVVYERACANFRRLREDVFVVDAQPSLYVYRLRMNGHVQTGLAGCFSVDDYDRDVIRKHERTRRDKEDDRTRHMMALRAQTGPVFLTYRSSTDVDALTTRVSAGEPLVDFCAADGVQHTMWTVDPASTGAFVAAFERIPALYIADGHHRAASASRAWASMRAAGRDSRADEPDAAGADTMLAVAFPDEQVQVLPYNRIVRDLAGHSVESFLRAVGERFTIEPGPAAPTARGEVSLYVGGRWQMLRPRDASIGGDPIASLDVTILQDQLLGPVLGIGDVRTDTRIDFVGGVRGTGELARLVDSGRAAAAFSLFAVRVTDLMSVSDAGGIMPPKSTWFEPKLRDGLLVHLI
jgi:uncharacterized protein (DUF1015 family)